MDRHARLDLALRLVTGRGTQLATARELALKLQETTRIAADALSATDALIDD